jgi:hypothetical protein
MKPPEEKVAVRCQLERLDLSHNEGLVGVLDGTEHIVLSGAAVSGSSASGSTPVLHSGADGHKEAFRVFCKSLMHNSVLSELDLSFCGLGPQSLAVLGEYAQKRGSLLRKLAIRGNALSGAVHMCGGKVKASDGTHVRTLDTQIDSEMSGVESFFDRAKPLSLEGLDIRECGLGSASAKHCALALPGSSVHELLADDDFLLDAIAIEPSTLARSERAEDLDFVHQAIAHNYQAVQYVDKFVGQYGLTDRGLVRAACLIDGRALRFASPLLRKDKCLAALAVSTAGRSNLYRDDFAAPPPFFSVIASKMQGDDYTRKVNAENRRTRDGQFDDLVGDSETEDQKYAKILEEFQRFDKAHDSRNPMSLHGYIDKRRLRAIAHGLHISLSRQDQRRIVDAAEHIDADGNCDGFVHYVQRTPDSVYRARVALFSKYAGSKQGVSAEKLVEALVEEYHSGELARAITRAEHDWLIAHLGSDAAKKSANRTRGMQLAELKEKSGAAEREKGLAAARVEVAASLDASLRTAKGPPNINPAAGKSVLRLASGLQKHVDRFDEILATGHKIKVATHLRTAESALGCGAFHPALSPRSPIAKRRVIWYADFRGRMPLDESMTKQASIDAFHELLNAKQIAPTTKVWVEGWQDWWMFRQVGLEGLLQQ